MITHAYDPAMHVLLTQVTGSSTSPDNERFMQAIDKLDQNGRDQGHAIAMILLLGADAAPPDAHWRRRFAEQRKALAAPAAYLSVVTTSALLRGVMTAMNWISPPPPHIKSQHHATFTEAAAWVELTQGAKGSALRALYAEATTIPRAKTG
jgi:hypothetical protein